MEIEWSAKEWARVIYLMKRATKKDPEEKDIMLFYKAKIFAEQAKKEEEEWKDLDSDI